MAVYLFILDWISRNPQTSFYIIVSLILSIFASIKLLQFRRVYNLIEKIPGPPCHPLPFMGHAGIVLDLDRTKFKHGTYALIYQMLTGIHCIYGKEKILRMWLGLRPFVLLYDADAVEVILSSNTLTDKSAEYSWLKPWLGEGLVTSNKNKWKTRRKILTPAFHFRILQDFLPIINEQSHVLVYKTRKMIREGKTSPYAELLPIVTLCTLDTICETAMGIKVGAQENESSYVKSLHQVSELVVFRLTRPWLWPDILFFNSSHGKRFKSCLKVMQDFTSKVIADRKKDWIQNNQHLLLSEDQNVSQVTKETKDQSEVTSSSTASNGAKARLAFLDLLLHQHLINKSLTLQDVREEVDTFMFAGHDTTAMAISWTLYMLGLHLDIQERVRDEVDMIFDDALSGREDKKVNGDYHGTSKGSTEGSSATEVNHNDQTSSEHDNHHDEDEEEVQVTTEMLKKMKYLDCVLKEVQRIYPTAPFVGRELTEDTTIAGYEVPQGTTCGILTFLLHRDPSIFPDPEVFNPDRFLPENCIGRHPFAYVPFSAGPRNCIGQKFAQMEQKIVVANFVRNFTFRSLDPRDKLVVVGEMVLRPRNGLRIEIKSRYESKKNSSSSSFLLSASDAHHSAAPAPDLIRSC